jgi:hypothetical protein
LLCGDHLRGTVSKDAIERDLDTVGKSTTRSIRDHRVALELNREAAIWSGMARADAIICAASAIRHRNDAPEDVPFDADETVSVNGMAIGWNAGCKPTARWLRVSVQLTVTDFP